jgi:hypothetical protein
MSAIADVFELDAVSADLRRGRAVLDPDAEARRMAAFLVERGGLAGAELELCVAVADDVAVMFDDEFQEVRDLYEAREREALLAGVKWEGGGL